MELHLDRLLVERGMTLTDLAAQVGPMLANLSVLMNGHTRTVRFSTLTALCDVLQCTPGDPITIRPIHSRH